MGNFNESLTLRRKISMFLDNELPKEMHNQVANTVESDAVAGRILRKEKDFREFVKNNVKRPDVSPQLVENIKNKLRQ
jgi:hypothetical protein